MRAKLLLFVLFSAITALVACTAKKEDAAAPASAELSEQDKTLYALGALVSQSLLPFEFTQKEVAMVQRGLADSLAKKTLAVKPEEYQQKVGELFQTRMAAASKRESDAGKALVDKAAQEPGAVKTGSGIVIKELKAGTGAKPAATDEVKVHYHGTLVDGTVFDSSVDRGEPATFPLNGVISCWTEGVQQMKVGGKSRLICPAELAYGDRGSPPAIKPGSTLIFDVELLEVVKR